MNDNFFEVSACNVKDPGGIIAFTGDIYSGDTTEIPNPSTIRIFTFPNAIQIALGATASTSLSAIITPTNKNILYRAVLDFSISRNLISGSFFFSANYFIDNSTQICSQEVEPGSIINFRVVYKRKYIGFADRVLPGDVWEFRIGRKISDNEIIASLVIRRTKRPLISNNPTSNDTFIVSKCSTEYPNFNSAIIVPDNYIGDELEIRPRPRISITFNSNDFSYEIQLQDVNFLIAFNAFDVIVRYDEPGNVISSSTELLFSSVICNQEISDSRVISIIVTEDTPILKAGDVYTLQVGRRVSDGQLIALSEIRRTKRPGFTN